MIPQELLAGLLRTEATRTLALLSFLISYQVFKNSVPSILIIITRHSLQTRPVPSFLPTQLCFPLFNFIYLFMTIKYSVCRPHTLTCVTFPREWSPHQGPHP